MSSVPFRVALALALLAVVASPIGALASAFKLRVVSSVPGQGYPTTAIATAKRVQHPTALFLRMTTDPKQPVKITYTLRCLKHGVSSTKTATWHGTSGTLARLALPVAKPSSCYATATAGAWVRSMRLQILAA